MPEPLAVLIADHDAPRREALAAALRADGFRVVPAGDGAEALEGHRNGRFALLVIRADLPEVTGVALCRTVRAGSRVPIIVVTASSDEEAVVAALESGADDCIPEPLRPREFVARARAAIRRGPPPPESDDGVVEVGDVRIDPAGFEVTVGGRRVDLTLKEFELLWLLAANAGRTLPRRTLLERVWGEAGDGESTSLDTHVRRLRAKIEEEPSHPTRIATVRGLGYRFNRERPGAATPPRPGPIRG